MRPTTRQSGLAAANEQHADSDTGADEDDESRYRSAIRLQLATIVDVRSIRILQSVAKILGDR
jgi:hypothetical protein